MSSEEPGAPGHEPRVLEAPPRGLSRGAPLARETGAAGEPARGLLPWPPVAVGLVAVLAVMLGIGLWANQALRPAVGVTPAAQLLPTATAGQAATPVSAAAAPASLGTALAPTAASAATASPTAGPLEAGSPVALATQAPATPPLAALPPATPAPLAAGSPSTVAPSPQPTVDPVLAAEVG